MTVAAETEYLLRVRRIQRHVEFELWNAAGTSLLGSSEYDASRNFADGTFGLYAFDANVTFDDFGFTRIDQINPAAPRWVSSAKAVLNPPAEESLPVETNLWGDVTYLSGFGDDDYIAQADVNLNSGDWAELIVRYVDPDNHHTIRIVWTHRSPGPVHRAERPAGGDRASEGASSERSWFRRCEGTWSQRRWEHWAL